MNSSDYCNFYWVGYKKQVDACVSKKYFLDYNPVDIKEEEFDAFYVSERYKILYIPISKNASTSLKTLIDFEPVYQIPKVQSQFDLEILEEYKKKYKVLVVTRHPKDRWVSGFNQFLSDVGIYLASKESRDILLELKKNKFIFDGHTLPQFSFIDYCFQPSKINFKIHLIKMDQNFDKNLSDFIGCDVTVNKKNLMEREHLKIKNHEICYKIFNDYCLRQTKFIDVYNQDYILYNVSK